MALLDSDRCSADPALLHDSEKHWAVEHYFPKSQVKMLDYQSQQNMYFGVS